MNGLAKGELSYPKQAMVAIWLKIGSKSSFHFQGGKGKRGVTRGLRVDVEGPLQKRQSPFSPQQPTGTLW